MRTLGIAIHDLGFTAVVFDAAAGTCTVLDTPPQARSGHAGWCGDRFVFGAEAEARLHTHPLLTSDRHWEPLSLAPVAIKDAAARGATRARLALGQLLECMRTWRAAGPFDRAAFSIPAAWTLAGDAVGEEAVGILLGFGPKLDIPLNLIAAAPVAAAAGAGCPAGVGLHVGWGLQALSLTLVVNRGDRVEQLAATRIAGLGQADFLKAMGARLAQRFLREASYDVTDEAGLEQVFHDAVVAALRRLRDYDEAALSLGRSREHRIWVTREEVRLLARTFFSSLGASAKAFFAASTASAPGFVLVSEKLGRLPVCEALQSCGALADGVPVQYLSEAHAPAAVARIAATLPPRPDPAEIPVEESLPLLPHLPLVEASAAPEATHLVVGPWVLALGAGATVPASAFGLGDGLLGSLRERPGQPPVFVPAPGLRPAGSLSEFPFVAGGEHELVLPGRGPVALRFVRACRT